MSTDHPPRTLVYLSGAPGAGKSTLMAHLTRHCGRTPITGIIAHDLLNLPIQAALPVGRYASAVELGRRRETFSGTDALSMSVLPQAEQYLARPGLARTLVLGEGDRLANMRFFTSARTLGWDLTVIHLNAPESLLDTRCAARGSTQSQTWRNGRYTKARNLVRTATEHGIPVVTLDARNDVPCLSTSAVEAVPALAALLPPNAPERHHDH